MLGEFTKTSLKKSIDFARYKYSQYLDESDFIKIENRIEYMLENQTFQNLIKDSSFTSEQSIIYNGEIKIIDLFVQKGDDFYIFDYKTTKEQMSEHEVQVNNYIKAIKEIMQTNRVKGYLLYLKPNEFVLKELI